MKCNTAQHKLRMGNSHSLATLSYVRGQNLSFASEPKVIKVIPWEYIINRYGSWHTLFMQACHDCSIRVLWYQTLIYKASKILVQLIYNNIIDHISKNNLTTVLQFGVLKHRSVVQQLFLFFDNIVCTNHLTDAPYLDFCKVFDSVPHNELLYRNLKQWESQGIYGYIFQVLSIKPSTMCQDK